MLWHTVWTTLSGVQFFCSVYNLQAYVSLAIDMINSAKFVFVCLADCRFLSLISSPWPFAMSFSRFEVGASLLDSNWSKIRFTAPISFLVRTHCECALYWLACRRNSVTLSAHVLCVAICGLSEQRASIVRPVAAVCELAFVHHKWAGCRCTEYSDTGRYEPMQSQ